jgi:hypothetical protein
MRRRKITLDVSVFGPWRRRYRQHTLQPSSRVPDEEVTQLKLSWSNLSLYSLLTRESLIAIRSPLSLLLD